MVTQTYKLNMIPNGQIINVHVSQYDIGRTIVFNLYNGAEVFTPAPGTTATIDGTKPDKKGFSVSATISGSTAQFTTTKNMCAVAGDTICEFRLMKNGQNVGTANFILNVERAGLADDVDISQTELPAYMDAAESSMRNSEAWAVGTKDGTPVSQSDPQYQNYSKYYAEQANSSALSASDSATSAAGDASDAEAWAVGKRDGQSVHPTDPTYENNALYYADRAAHSVAQGTQVDFYISNGHLYLVQTIQGVEQPPEDVGPVGGSDNVTQLDVSDRFQANSSFGTTRNLTAYAEISGNMTRLFIDFLPGITSLPIGTAGMFTNLDVLTQTRKNDAYDNALIPFVNGNYHANIIETMIMYETGHIITPVQATYRRRDSYNRTELFLRLYGERKFIFDSSWESMRLSFTFINNMSNS